MAIESTIEKAVFDAWRDQQRVKIFIRSGKQLYEGLIDRIYENKIIRFAMGKANCKKIYGFVLINDILEVI